MDNGTTSNSDTGTLTVDNLTTLMNDCWDYTFDYQPNGDIWKTPVIEPVEELITIGPLEFKNLTFDMGEERQFKIGDEVEDPDGNKGTVICDSQNRTASCDHSGAPILVFYANKGGFHDGNSCGNSNGEDGKYKYDDTDIKLIKKVGEKGETSMEETIKNNDTVVAINSLDPWITEGKTYGVLRTSEDCIEIIQDTGIKGYLHKTYFKSINERGTINMVTLTEAQKRGLSKDAQAQVRAGLLNTDLTLTDKGRDALVEIALEQNTKDFTDRANAIIKEEEAKSKK